MKHISLFLAALLALFIPAHAADIDLSGDKNRPTLHAQASVGTTWQSYTLPSQWSPSKLTVQCSAACYIAFDTTSSTAGETPADGGAVGTHKWPLAADSPLEFRLRQDDHPERDNIAGGVSLASQVFVAAQSGTATVYLLLE